MRTKLDDEYFDMFYFFLLSSQSRNSFYDLKLHKQTGVIFNTRYKRKSVQAGFLFSEKWKQKNAWEEKESNFGNDDLILLV